LMRFKRSYTEPVPKRREEGFAKAGVAAFQGRARFVGRPRFRWARRFWRAAMCSSRQDENRRI
jgi:hypothetical protein